jgi:hypothetical protein
MRKQTMRWRTTLAAVLAVALAMITARKRRVVAAGVVGALAAASLVALAAGSAAATTVTSETSFRNAWGNSSETQVDLFNDITLTCAIGGVAGRDSATPLTVDGHGHTIRQSCDNNGVLQQSGLGSVTFSNVTITGGHTLLRGGGISATASASVTLTNTTVSANTGIDGGGGIFAGPVALTNSTVSDNSAVASCICPGGIEGAGIWANGPVTVANSTVSGNTTPGNTAPGGDGGGIWAAGPVTVTNSTVSGNAAPAGNGGGIYGPALTVANSTVSGNSAGGNGGGIWADSPAAVTNSTVSGNSASTSGGMGGGGIYNLNGPLTLTNSTVSGNAAPGGDGGGIYADHFNSSVTLTYATVAGNTAGGRTSVFTHGALTSFGSAVVPGRGVSCQVGSTTSWGFNFSVDFSCGFTTGTDQQSAVNPRLGALADNGGPTQTRLPQPGSPLLDAIPPASCQADDASGITTDQRGITRPQGSGCDIGAVEVEAAAADTTPPVITHNVSGTLGNGGWYTGDVAVTWSVTDDQSAITSQGDCDPTTVNTDTDPSGVTLTCAATSAGGTASDPVTITRDATPPTVTIACPATPVPQHGLASAAWTASDAAPGSGLASDASGSVTLDTASAGPHTATAPTATDHAGNTSAPASCSYSVVRVYDFSGFFNPVANDGVLNVTKAGSAVPVKFSLNGDQGLDIMAAGSPSSGIVACSSTAGADQLDATVSAGGSSLTYDPTSDQYIYVWKTDKTWAGQCRLLSVSLNDGTTHTALFQFTK